MGYAINKEEGISDYYYCRKISEPWFYSHIHSHIEFVYVLKGCVNITVEGKSSEISENNVAVIMPYEIHSYDSSSSTEAFVLACPPEYVSEYRNTLVGNVFEPYCVAMDDIHKAIVKQIIQSSDEKNMMKKALIYCTLSSLINNCNIKERNFFEYDLYRKAIVYICEHYTEGIGLDDVAKYTGVTKSHLSRVLNNSEKSGFSDIVNSLRAHAAKDLIERDTMPVSEIALNVGFGSIRNFNRIFKEQFGITPKELRKR